MREKVMALELGISSGAEEKGQYEVGRALQCLILRVYGASCGARNCHNLRHHVTDLNEM